MKIEQTTPVFNPVTITLETRDEADMFWGILNEVYNQYPIDSPERVMLISMSNAFSCDVHW
jgi:hypothetical protein